MKRYQHLIALLIPVVVATGSCGGAGDSDERTEPSKAVDEAPLQRVLEGSPAPALSPESAPPISDREAHDTIYRQHRRVLDIVGELTEIDRTYRDRPFSAGEEKSRIRRVKTLVESAADDPPTLIMVARICAQFRSVFDNHQAGVPAYDIAFFHAVKTVAKSSGGDPVLMNELRSLRNLIGDSPAADFQRALAGEDPRDLYGLP